MSESYALPYRGGVLTELPGRRRMSGALHRVDWSSVINLGESVKP